MMAAITAAAGMGVIFLVLTRIGTKDHIVFALRKLWSRCGDRLVHSLAVRNPSLRQGFVLAVLVAQRHSHQPAGRYQSRARGAGYAAAVSAAVLDGSRSHDACCRSKSVRRRACRHSRGANPVRHLPCGRTARRPCRDHDPVQRRARFHRLAEPHARRLGAAIIFGITSPLRCLLGGIAMGVAEALAAGYTSGIGDRHGAVPVRSDRAVGKQPRRGDGRDRP